MGAGGGGGGWGRLAWGEGGGGSPNGGRCTQCGRGFRGGGGTGARTGLGLLAASFNPFRHVVSSRRGVPGSCFLPRELIQARAGRERARHRERVSGIISLRGSTLLCEEARLPS